MNAPLLLWSLWANLSDSVTTDARLRDVRWSTRHDTLRVDFVFEGSRPARFRVSNSAQDRDRPALGVHFDGVRWRRWSGSLPSWIHGAPSADSNGLSMQVDLRRPSVWRAAWTEDVLSLEVAGRPKSPLWADPRVLGLAGVGLAAGATTIWFASQEESRPASPSPTPDDGIIPPPGFGFPK